MTSRVYGRARVNDVINRRRALVNLRVLFLEAFSARPPN